MSDVYDGALAMRRIYGQGLDEVVRQEADADGDGLLETVTIPVYDSIGNAVAITDASGKAIERYEHTPYGTRTIRVDLTPPAVEQLREAGGKLLLEFSEEILLQRVRDAITSSQLTLRDTTDDAPIAIIADQPVRDGKQKGRRLLLTPDPVHPPAANHGMLLHIEPGAMVDLFENRPEMAYEKAFVWLAADQAIDDTTPPRVDLVLTKAGELEVGFSEEIDPAVASAAILLYGAPRTWTAMPDGYTLKPASAISATTHSLQIGPALIDKAGRPLAETFARNITTGGTDQIAYERPDLRITPTSTLDNLASFQGHITDPATGLVYMRNRWMDPEMGRFITPDPMGYTSGPSSYDGFGGSPFVTCDPFGLYEADLHFGLTYFIAKSFGLTFGEALQVAEADENIDLFDWTNPTLQARQGNWQVVYDFHFPLVGSHESVREGVSASSNEAAWSGIFSAQNLSELGYGLHTLQDSFSHAGATRGNLLSKLALTNAQAVARLAIKSPELGITHNIHASDISNYGDFNGTDVPGMHAVDWTFTNPSKAMRAARATFQAIEFFCQARTSNQCASPVASRARLSELEAVIRQFASADTAKGKKEWFMLYAPEVLSLIPWDDLSLDSRITHR